MSSPRFHKSFLLIWFCFVFACSEDPVRPILITSVIPESDGPGNEVQISGQGFGTNLNAVSLDFNGTEAEVVYIDDTLLITQVPLGATSGKINLSLSNQQVSSPNDFIVLSGNWTQKQDLPYEQGFGATVSFSISGKGYLGTGSDNGSSLDLFWGYDPAIDQWVELPSIPNGARRFSSSFVIDGQAYIGLGRKARESDLTPEFYRFDPNTESWTQLNNFPGELPSFTDTYATFTIIDESFLLLRKEVWAYDPAHDEWSQRSTYPGFGTSNHVAHGIDGMAYIGLGFSDAFDWWRYNPQNEEWNDLSTYPGPFTWGVQSFEINGKIYVIGKECWMYDPSTDLWEQKNSHPDGRRFASAFSIGHTGYLGTGISISGSEQPFQKDLWAFDPE